MNIYARSLFLAFGLLSVHAFAAALADQEQSSNSTEQGEETVFCTTDALEICIAYEPKRYSWVTLGRLGPNCEFPILPFEVDAENCKGVEAPQKPMVCEMDARLACVQKVDKSYETVTLGRLGPNCSFPILPSEVDESFCGTLPPEDETPSGLN